VHGSEPAIKLMWDYGCWTVWQFDGEIFENVRPESLPLSGLVIIISLAK